jgi:hypothetical protein
LWGGAGAFWLTTSRAHDPTANLLKVSISQAIVYLSSLAVFAQHEDHQPDDSDRVCDGREAHPKERF